jgi:hypothetical protein
MKLELTSIQAAEVKPWLDRCREAWTPCVLAGQLMLGDWRQGPDKIFLHYALIRRETARKIRKLIERDEQRVVDQRGKCGR